MNDIDTPDRGQIDTWIRTHLLPETDEAVTWGCAMLFRPTYHHETAFQVHQTENGVSARLGIALGSWAKHAGALIRLGEGDAVPPAPPVYRARIDIDEEALETIKVAWKGSLYAQAGDRDSGLSAAWWITFEGEVVDEQVYAISDAPEEKAAVDFIRSLFEVVRGATVDPVVVERLEELRGYLF